MLKQGRRSHNAIHIHHGQFLVVGGHLGHSVGEGYKLFTEKCILQNGQMNCVSQQPELDDYAAYPELKLVPETFCKH